MSQYNRALYELANLALSDSFDDAVHSSVDSVASRIGVSRSTAGRALKRLRDVGAVDWLKGSRGLILQSKEKPFDVYKTTWSRKDGLIGLVSPPEAVKLVSDKKAVWGGCRAAAYHSDGYVAASPFSDTVYVIDPYLISDDAESDEGAVCVYRWINDELPDSGYSTKVQTLTELFNTPGFVPNEFYEELRRRLFR